MSAQPLLLRCKSKSGQHVLKELSGESSIRELKQRIEALTNIPADSQKILSGFPPKLIDISDGAKSLTTAMLRSGDTLIVEEDQNVKVARTENILQQLAGQEGMGILTRQVVPANNSCLFTSVHFVTEGGRLDLGAAPGMRQIIASVVASDQDVYSEAMLGKSNADYCAWISNDETWGGAIEISILSKYFAVEIDVVDTQYVRVDRFGEDKGYSNRVLLIYDGIHYDPLMLEPADPSQPIQTVFPTSDPTILAQAMELASEAKASRQFTDVNKFSLRCLVCNKALTGQTEAQQHAKITGHINFGEY